MGHRRKQLDSRLALAVVLLQQSSLAGGDDAGVVPDREQALQLADPGSGVLVDSAGPCQEEVERLTRPLGDELEGLHRRLGFACLDEVDRGPADVVPRDLTEAEAGQGSRLFDRTGPDLETAAAPATAARGGLPLPSRAVRLRSARGLCHGGSA